MAASIGVNEINIDEHQPIQCLSSLDCVVLEGMGRSRLGDPMHILNPVFEAYFEEWHSEGGDFDRILLDASGLWHWEHSAYFPEFYHGLRLTEEEGHGYDPDPWHPIYGEEVNSMCWYMHYTDVRRLIRDVVRYIPVIRTGEFIFPDEGISQRMHPVAFVNPEHWKFAPRSSVECVTATRKPFKLNRYTHWLSFGFTEEAPIFSIYYPMHKTANITVKILNSKNELIGSIRWTHGCRGLFDKIKKEHHGNPGRYNFPVRSFATYAFEYQRKLHAERDKAI